MFRKKWLSNSKYLPYVIIFLIVLFIGIDNYFILKQDKLPLFHDQFDNYYISIQIKESKCFLSSGLSQKIPVLHFFIILPILIFFKISPDLMAMANLLYFSVLLIGIYLIGVRLKGKKEGVIACFITATCPGMFGFSRVLYLEIPVAAVVTFIVYFKN